MRFRFCTYSFVLLTMMSCKPDIPVAIKLEGKTMGTTYHITYFDHSNRNFQISVDSLLVLVNASINTYDTASEISRFNRSERSLTFNLPYFLPPLKKSKEVFAGSEEAYDPTVMPLVNAWGFGPRKIDRPDTSEIMAVREYVGFQKISFNDDSVWKSNPHVQLDFSAIGQGYGADVIAEFFKSRSIENFFIELGGEGVVLGRNILEDRAWQIGILDPTSDEMESKFIGYVTIRDKGFTTSGNYYNYRIVDGKRYSHTLDPMSGFPVQHELLSATVFADNCATADAWATAFMSMGHIKAIGILKIHPEINVVFVYASANGNKIYISERIGNDVKLNN